jgi:hypothetical protein
MELYLHSHILLNEVTLNQELSRINKYPSNSHVCRLLITSSSCVQDDGLIESRHIKQFQFSISNTCRFQWPLACRDCGFESLRGHGYLSLLSVECGQVEISASELSLVQRSTTECGVSECDRESTIIRRPWPTAAVAPL